MNVFRFILLTLSAYRLTRLITSDAWPPTKRFREWVEERTGAESGWTTLVSCPWCSSVYLCSVVFLVDRYLWSPPIWLLGMVSAMAIAGLLGTYDER